MSQLMFEELKPERASQYAISEGVLRGVFVAFGDQLYQLIKYFTDFLNFGFVKFGDALASALTVFSNTIVSDVKNMSSDNNSIILDPTPFREIIRVITTKTKPTNDKSFTEKMSSTDLNALKSLVTELVECVVTWGLSAQTFWLPFLKSATNVLKKIDAVSKNDTVTMKEHDDGSIEVKDDGSVIIAIFDFQYKGEVTKNCCSTSTDMELTVDVKAWKFPTRQDLQVEYERFKNA